MELRKRGATGHISKLTVAEGEPSIFFRYDPKTGKYFIFLGLFDNRGDEYRVSGSITEWERAFEKVRNESMAIKSAISQRAKVRTPPRPTVRSGKHDMA